MTVLSLRAQNSLVKDSLNQQENSVDIITVTAEKESLSGLIDAPVKVEVLDKDYFSSQQYQDVSQGIADIPGVSQNTTSRRAGASTALIQGFGENSVLVMIDGVPVSQNSSFGFDLSQIAVADLEKVEVIKGGASALYGSQAMGGVINIVTRRPQNKSTANLDISTIAIDEDSSYAQNVQFNTSGKYRSFGGKVSLSLRRQNDFDLDPTSIAREGISYQKIHTSLFLEKDFNKIKVFSNIILLDEENASQSSRPYTSSTFGPSLNKTKVTTQNLKLGVEGKSHLGNFRFLVNSERSQDRLALNDNPNTDFLETFKETSFEAKRLDLIFRDVSFLKQKLTFGALIKKEKVNQETTTQAVEQIVVKTKDIDEKEISSYESYLQSVFFIDDIELAPGVRYQYDRDFGSFVSPKLNVSLYKDIGEFASKVWFTIGTGLRSPSVKERFFTLDHTSVANYVVVGNDRLDPEESVSFQVGQELKYDFFIFHTNFFLNNVSNLIDTVEVETETTRRLFTYNNFNKVLSRGIETGLTLNLTEKFSSKLNYTYSETINRESNLLLANRPLHVGLVSLQYNPIEKLRLNTMGRYSGAKYTDNENKQISPSFVTLDLRIDYQWSRKFSIYGSLNNILDTTRVPLVDTVVPIIDDRPTLGRQILLGMKAELI